MAAWLRQQGQSSDAKIARARVERRVARLKEVYLLGDMDPAEYQRRRADLLAARDALPLASATSEDVARRLAGFLADLPSAWAVATPDERNRLARQLLAEAIIDNRTVVAVKPRPELLPFFRDLFIGGSDGDRLRMIDVVVLPLIPFLYPERLLHARRRSGVGRYATTAKGPRIPPERWPEVAARAKYEGLRAVARDLGVSHETVRAIVQRVMQAARTASQSGAGQDLADSARVAQPPIDIGGIGAMLPSPQKP